MSAERTAPTPNAEQAADLARLKRQASEETDAAAAEVEAAEVEAAEAEAEAKRPDLGAELAGLITICVRTLAPAFPSLPSIYTDEATQEAAGAVAAVCNKHGWMQEGGMFGKWGEEIACAAVCLPLAVATYQGVKGDIAARQDKEPEPGKPEPLPAGEPAAPGSKTVTFGTVTT